MINKNNRQGHVLINGRNRRGWSQFELAKASGISKLNGQLVSNVERGEIILPKKHIVGVCKALNIPYGHLIFAMVEDYKDCLSSTARNQADKL